MPDLILGPILREAVRVGRRRWSQRLGSQGDRLVPGSSGPVMMRGLAAPKLHPSRAASSRIVRVIASGTCGCCDGRRSRALTDEAKPAVDLDATVVELLS
jgi:hypothetical protein